MRFVAKTPSGWYERKNVKLTPTDRQELFYGYDDVKREQILKNFREQSVVKLQDNEADSFEQIFQSFNVSGELIVANLMVHSKRASVVTKINNNYKRNEFSWSS